MQSTTAAKTIEELKNIFVGNGIPHQLVSDNGPQFVSDEFRNFMKVNSTKHIRTAVYHPLSNGEAERFVQTFKNALKRENTDPGSLKQKLAQFLLRYRMTPVGLGKCVLNNTRAGAVTWGIESGGDETNPFVGFERNNVADERIE